MPAQDHARPSRLYLYGQRSTLERALTLGEFRLQPLATPLHTPQPQAAFLVLNLAQEWDEARLHAASSAPACLVIHDPEDFGERLHRAVQKILPAWAGIDAAVSYGTPSPLGKAFTAPAGEAGAREWRFAWRPTQAVVTIAPLVVRLGNIESLAELHLATGH